MDKEIIFGVNSVREAIYSHNRKIYKVYIAAERDRLSEIVSLAKKKGIKIEYSSRGELNRLIGNVPHQGIAAEVSKFEYVAVEDLLHIDGSDFTNVVLLDGVSDPHNLGAIIRTAFLMGFKGIITVKHRSAPVTPVVVKTSAGATERLPVARVTNLSRTIEQLKDNGFWIVCATEKATSYLWQLDYKFNVALIMGDEGSGLRKLTLQKCDFKVKIPIIHNPTLNSLNVSVAAAILMYEIMKRQENFLLP